MTAAQATSAKGRRRGGYALSGVALRGAGGHHERQQVLFGAWRMAVPRLRGPIPLSEGMFTLAGGRFHRADQPCVKAVGDRCIARVSVTAHVVKAHAASHNQHAFVA